MLCSIGEFHKVHYQPILKKYAYNRILLYLLGKNECKKLEDEFLKENNYVMTESDSAEALKTEFTCKSSQRHLYSTEFST